MKKLLTFLMVLVFGLFGAIPTIAQQTEFLYCSDYASFAAALTAIGGDECTLVISEEEDVATDTTIPSTMTLKFLAGGYLDIAEEELVTIKGNVEAGLYKIFEPHDVYHKSIQFGDASDNSLVDHIHPEWWGAIAGDSTDDNPSFRHATKSIYNGNVIQLSEGQYVVDTIFPEGGGGGPAVYGCILVPDKTTIRGMGTDATEVFLKAAVESQPVIGNADQTNGNEEILIEGFRIFGNKANTTGNSYGVYFIHCSDVVVRDMEIIQTCKNGVFAQDSTWFRVEGCTIGDVGEALDALSNGIDVRDDCVGFQITNNRVYGSYGHGIRVQEIISGHPNLYGIIANNIVSTVGYSWEKGLAISGESCKYIIVDGNITMSNNNNGFDFKTCEHIVVSGNNSYNNEIHGFCFDTCQDSQLTGNESMLNDRGGFYIVNCDRITLTGNRAQNNGDEGAHIDDGILIRNSRNCLVNSNQCMDTQGTKTQSYGIKEDNYYSEIYPYYDDCAANLYVGNNVKQNITAGIDLVAADSRAHHNITDVSIARNSAASMTFPDTGEAFNVMGTTDITSITASWKGRILYLKFSDELTVTDGSNLKLEGNFDADLNYTLVLLCADGVNWYELTRAVN